METPPNQPQGPQSPAGSPPQPQPPGPQSPSPAGAPTQPPSPGPPAAPAPGAPPQPTGAPGYTGPVPPGGWQQPIVQPPASFAGAAFASWGSRVGALLLDALILLVPTIVVVALIIAVALSGSEAGTIVTAIVSTLAFFVVALVYAPLLMSRGGKRNGQTYGKQAVGIRVVRANGQPFSFGTAMLREFVVKGLLFGFVGSLLLYIPTIIDWLWPLWDDQDRALHDMVVDTRVVRT